MSEDKRDHPTVKGAGTSELVSTKRVLLRLRDVGATNKNPDGAITAWRVIRPPQRARGVIKGAILGRVGKTSRLMVVDLSRDLNWDAALPSEQGAAGPGGPPTLTLLGAEASQLAPLGPCSRFTDNRTPINAEALWASLLQGVCVLERRLRPGGRKKNNLNLFNPHFKPFQK